jgi:1-acyl-sn-glycerol-3-phosphate acyltransferase
MKREALLAFTKFVLNIITQKEFLGLEHLPKTGGVIITTNHMSRMDIPFLFVNPIRSDITALVTDKYRKNSIFGLFTTLAGGIWIDRTKADFTALKEALSVLKAGRALGISPEGTRSNIGQLLEGKAGTALIATKAGVPIVPVALSGTEDAFKKIGHFKRAKLVMRFGPAYTLPPIDRENREASQARATEEIMCRIAVLLPEKYHGFYAGHPRVKELQKEQGEASD